MINDDVIKGFCNACKFEPLEKVKKFLFDYPILMRDERCQLVAVDASITNEDRSVVEYLIKIGEKEHGAKFFLLKNQYGQTALHGFAKFGDSTLMSHALQRGALVNTQSADEEAILHYAATNRQADIIRLLIEHGANIRAVDNWQRTALHKVADLASTSLLLEAGANPNTLDKFNSTPLHLFARNDACAASFELLINAGADVGALDGNGQIALHIAKNSQIIVALLKAGSNVHVKDQNDRIALHTVCSAGGKDVCQLLIDSGSDVNAKDNLSKTPLHFARDADSIKALLEGGALVNAQDIEANTALHLRSLDGHTAFAELLIQGGADINARSFDGETPLIIACRGGFEDLVILLLEAGADHSISDNYGSTIATLSNGNASLKAIWNAFLAKQEMNKIIAKNRHELLPMVDLHNRHYQTITPYFDRRAR